MQSTIKAIKLCNFYTYTAVISEGYILFIGIFISNYLKIKSWQAFILKLITDQLILAFNLIKKGAFKAPFYK